jgi:hypothetical protein
MSALHPEEDMLIVGINVCFVPIADIATLPKKLARSAARRCVSEGPASTTARVKMRARPHEQV